MKTKLTIALLTIISAFSAGAGETVTAFDGSSIDGWEVKKKDKGANKWTLGEPKVIAENPKKFEVTADGDEKAMINAVGDHNESWDIFSKAKFGSSRIEVEFMVAKDANSGVYVMGEYEVQILDSYGKETMGNGDMGAIYGAKPASANPCKKHGEWQKYVIEFQAPEFDAEGKKTANAKFIKVELNGVVVQENVDMPGPTPGGLTGKEAATGPLMFQGDHGPVAIRSVKITPLK